jgi:hypothetical protein
MQKPKPPRDEFWSLAAGTALKLVVLIVIAPPMMALLFLVLNVQLPEGGRCLAGITLVIVFVLMMGMANGLPSHKHTQPRLDDAFTIGDDGELVEIRKEKIKRG